MSDLHRAIIDIRSIRRQVAQTAEFHGYGPLTLSATAVLALLTGTVQAYWLPQPDSHPVQYVALWLTTGMVSAALILTQMLRRADRLHSALADEMIRLAVVQFLPAAVAGLVLPLLLLQVTHNVFWMMPGLWQVLFSLGVFSSCRCLSRLMYVPAGWFLMTGLASIAEGDARALRPEVMSFSFGVGMAQVALIHFFSARRAERNEDDEA